jgi:hypothetical protein
MELTDVNSRPSPRGGLLLSQVEKRSGSGLTSGEDGQVLVKHV